MGTQGRGFMEELFLGSVAHNISRVAACPMLADSLDEKMSLRVLSFEKNLWGSNHQGERPFQAKNPSAGLRGFMKNSQPQPGVPEPKRDQENFSRDNPPVKRLGRP